MSKEIAALYARVSTREQAEHGFSMDMQVLRLHQYLELYMDIPKDRIVEYLEPGSSGKDLKRVVIQEVLEGVKAGVITTLAVYKLDRLTRDVGDLVTLLNLVDVYNIRLISVSEHIDTNTPMGRFMIFQMILIAQLERENILQRTTEGILGSAYKGNYVYGNTPYGYFKEEGKLIVDEEEARVVKSIYSVFLKNRFALRTLAMIYTSENVGGRTWSEKMIRKVLTNKIYLGDLTVRGEVIEGHSPRIIDAESFTAAQILIESRGHLYEHDYIFHGMCFCSRSGEPLDHTSTIKGKGRIVYIYYYSEAYKKRINEKDIIVQITAHIDKYIEVQKKSSVGSAMKTIKNQSERMHLLAKLVDEGLIGKDYYESKSIQLQGKYAFTNSQIRTLQERINKWSTMTLEEMSSFVQSHIERIEIDIVNKKVKKVVFK